MIQTAVSSYIQEKLDNFPKDKFLKDISHNSLSRQIAIIEIAIGENIEYIDKIKSDERNYQIINEKKELRPFLQKQVAMCQDDIKKYRLYSDYAEILENYANKKQRITDKIYADEYDFSLTDKQKHILKSIPNIDFSGATCQDLSAVAKYLIENYDQNCKQIIINMVDELNKIYKHSQYQDDYYIYINSLNLLTQHKINMSNTDKLKQKDLKEIKKKIEKIVIHYDKKQEDSYDSRYETLESLIDDEPSFNRLLDESPILVNARDKSGNTIAYNILVRFLDSYFLELQGTNTSISKEYYLNLYNKVTSNPHFELTPIDTEEFDALVQYFVKVIELGHFNKEVFLHVSNSLNTIKH